MKRDYSVSSHISCLWDGVLPFQKITDGFQLKISRCHFLHGHNVGIEHLSTYISIYLHYISLPYIELLTSIWSQKNKILQMRKMKLKTISRGSLNILQSQQTETR